MHPSENFVPIALFIAMAVIFWKYFDSRHKENMAMIERGMSIAPVKPPVDRTSRFLTFGLLAMFVSIALIVGLIITHNFGVVEDVIPALMILGAGLAMMANYGIARDQAKDRNT